MDDAKQLALTLLQRLIDLEIERAAMSHLLDFCKDIDTQQPLNWKPKVQKNYADSAIQGSVQLRYAAIEQKMQAATSDCPSLLSLLASIPVDRVWE